MWPWEHAALGYLGYSLGYRLLGRDPPGNSDTVALGLATQLPDLVDKSLAWGLGLFPTGFAIAHSVFVALPVGVAALALGRRRERVRESAGFIIGYWSHLVADVVNPLRTGGQPLFVRVLWPLVEMTAYDADYGLGRGLVYIQEFIAAVRAMNPLDVLVLYALLPGMTLALWIVEGTPGTAVFRRACTTVRHRVR